MSLLQGIHGPEDLKNLSRADLKTLAEEIRSTLVQTLSVTGGHLAPNLGTVELSIALHRVFNSPKDIMIWDVGHQAYIHKLLTGRFDRFSTIRQYEGLSGYCKRGESPHDYFGAGHGSTSISAALGFAVARDRRGRDENVIAVIGDGSMTGGMALEAMNHAGHIGARLLVVLNDNEMSISPNVGALHHYFTNIRTNPAYVRAKARFEALALKLPMGESMVEFANKARDAVTTVGTPGLWFEELGFTYLGPIDGHNLDVLEATLEHTKSLNGPILLHVITVKGRGYTPAEENSTKFHGVAPFVIETGLSRKKSSTLPYSDVFVQALRQLARTNDKIVAISAAMLEGTGLVKFQEEFPDRTFDVGMAEQHAVTFGCGLAAHGLRPVVAIYSTFLQRAFDQVLHDACIQKLPITLVLDRGGIVGEDGPTHQGVFDMAYLRMIPNIVVMASSDEEELRRMMRTAVEHEGPAAIRFPRANSEGIPVSTDIEAIPIGQGVRMREGKDVGIIAIGSMVYPSLEAADTLASEGIRATVVNARFVKPLDAELVASTALGVPHLVTVEEGCLMGGFGSAVLEELEARNIRTPVTRIGLPDKFIEHGGRDFILDKYGLSAEGIADCIRKVLGKAEPTPVTAAVAG